MYPARSIVTQPWRFPLQIPTEDGRQGSSIFRRAQLTARHPAVLFDPINWRAAVTGVVVFLHDPPVEVLDCARSGAAQKGHLHPGQQLAAKGQHKPDPVGDAKAGPRACAKEHVGTCTSARTNARFIVHVCRRLAI